MSATILQLDPDVAAKFKFAQAAARKYEEALNLARELGLGRDQLRLA